MPTKKGIFQKNPRAHENKISTPPPPPPQNPKSPPPKRRNFTDMGFSCRKNAFFPGVPKIGAAISGPRIADRKFYGHEDFEGIPRGPARHLDVPGQKLSPHCLETIFDSQLPSPKSSPKMPPKLSLPHRRGHFFPLSKLPLR